MKCSIIIPALNEEDSVGRVLDALPKEHLDRVIVVDNGSTDQTAEVAQEHGAIALDEPRKGYGQACLKGLAYLNELSEDEKPEVVAFVDADFSDDPGELPRILAPIKEGKADLVIGSRALGNAEKGSMTIPQIFGNWLATTLIRWLFGKRFTDLGPFRAVRYDALKKINMQDTNFGWTVEMQIKVAKLGLPCCEVPVSYRKRIGKSKISGTVKGTFQAGTKILWTIYQYR